MAKPYLALVLLIFILQAHQTVLQEQFIDAIIRVFVDNQLPFNLVEYDLENLAELNDLIANGVGGHSSRTSQWRYSEIGWQNLKLLHPQTGESRQPPQWNIFVLKCGIWKIAVLMRNDNLYICGYWSNSRPGWREFKTQLIPDSTKVNFGPTYADLNGKTRANLTNVRLSKYTLGDAVRSLDIESDDDELKPAFVVLLLMLTETQRFTSIRDCVITGLDNGCFLTPKDVAFLAKWGELSCALLEGWPNIKRYNKLRALMATYNIREEDVPGMLVVLLQGRKCRNNMIHRELIIP